MIDSEVQLANRTSLHVHSPPPPRGGGFSRALRRVGQVARLAWPLSLIAAPFVSGGLVIAAGIYGVGQLSRIRVQTAEEIQGASYGSAGIPMSQSELSLMQVKLEANQDGFSEISSS